MVMSYHELLDDVAYALQGRGLEGEHGVLAIEGREGGAVGVEGLVVVFDELLCAVISACSIVAQGLVVISYWRCSRSLPRRC